MHSIFPTDFQTSVISLRLTSLDLVALLCIVPNITASIFSLFQQAGHWYLKLLCLAISDVLEFYIDTWLSTNLSWQQKTQIPNVRVTTSSHLALLLSGPCLTSTNKTFHLWPECYHDSLGKWLVQDKVMISSTFNCLNLINVLQSSRVSDNTTEVSHRPRSLQFIWFINGVVETRREQSCAQRN